jgi:hypothetical protein
MTKINWEILHLVSAEVKFHKKKKKNRISEYGCKIIYVRTWIEDVLCNLRWGGFADAR